MPVSGPYYLAYSGGMDSHVLLHALSSIKAELGADIHAVHINHNINSSADSWRIHCENICKELAINFTVLKIDETCPQGESREAWARRLRYQLLASQVGDKGVLLTAHHQDDQAETLLLQLTRGAGVKGLAAMPALKKVDGMWHARPLLKYARGQLLDYARHHNLQWIEDDSNSDIAYDRNFFRQDVFPGLRQRWPNIAATLSRVAIHQAEAMKLLDELAESDFAACRDKSEDCLNIDRLTQLSTARQVNLLRHWLRRLDLPVPDTRIMQEILNQFLSAKADAMPLISWAGTELRRYQHQLYASRPLPDYDKHLTGSWQLDSPCQFGPGVLEARLKRGPGIRTDVCPDKQLQVRYRQGGEKIRLKNKTHRQTLKKLFQESGVPPWLRERIPLLYKDGKLIAVADLWIDSEACSTKAEKSWHISWTSPAGFNINISKIRED